MTEDQAGITFAFTLLIVTSSWGAVLLSGWGKWAGVCFTYIASFMLAFGWQLSPDQYLAFCLLVPPLLFSIWKICVGTFRQRKGRMGFTQARH